MGTNSTILDVLKNGYKIPFIRPPTPRASLDNNKSAKINGEFVTDSIYILLKIKRIVVCVNPLSVPTIKAGKKRHILDLSRLGNNFLWKEKVKFEDTRSALKYMSKEGYKFMYPFDLSAGYHHINIFSKHQTFLGFSWQKKYYKYTVLPLGISTAGFIFTKVLRELIKQNAGSNQ